MTKGISDTYRTERRRAIAKAAAAERRSRDRFFIQINVKGALDHKTGKYRRYVWPKLFKTSNEAWSFARCVGVFRNIEAIPGRGKIRSYTVEKVTLKKVAP